MVSENLTLGSKLTDALAVMGDSFDVSEQFANLSVPTILITLLTAALCGAVIYLVYRFFYRGVVYSDNFNILLLTRCE